jgi:hypothetical protein
MAETDQGTPYGFEQGFPNKATVHSVAYTAKEIDTENPDLLVAGGIIIMFKLHLNRSQQQALTSKGWIERLGARTPLRIRDYVIHLGRERFINPRVRLVAQGETKHMALDDISEGETEEFREFCGLYEMKQLGPYAPSRCIPQCCAARDVLMPFLPYRSFCSFINRMRLVTTAREKNEFHYQTKFKL